MIAGIIKDQETIKDENGKYIKVIKHFELDSISVQNLNNHTEILKDQIEELTIFNQPKEFNFIGLENYIKNVNKQ